MQTQPQPQEQLPLQIAEAITKGTSGVIIIPANPTIDAIAAGTALYLALTKIGKNVSILGANVPENDLSASDKIQNSFTTKGDNLVISFPYTDGSIDKVDYNIQGTTFNLVITPRQGQPKLDPEKVQYTYTGGAVDFIITVDTPNLNTLGFIYTDNQKEFQGKTIINIDRHLINNMFGTINYVVKTSSSTSELVAKIINTMKAEIDKDIATNLYTGLTSATNFFSSYSVNADTFETASILLKNGAQKRAPARPPQTQPQPYNQQYMQQPRPTATLQQPMQTVQSIQRPIQRPQAPVQNQPRPQQHQVPHQTTSQAEEFEDMSQAPLVKPQTETKNASQPTPQDWLKPKIFRGGGLV